MKSSKSRYACGVKEHAGRRAEMARESGRRDTKRKKELNWHTMYFYRLLSDGGHKTLRLHVHCKQNKHIRGIEGRFVYIV